MAIRRCPRAGWSACRPCSPRRMPPRRRPAGPGARLERDPGQHPGRAAPGAAAAAQTAARGAAAPPVGQRHRHLDGGRLRALRQAHPAACRPLDALDADPGALDRGIIVHRALERFVAAMAGRAAGGRRAAAAACSACEVSSPSSPIDRRCRPCGGRASCRSRAGSSRRSGRAGRAWSSVLAEVTGELELAAAGRPLRRCARAPIGSSSHADGSITVIDYKTGQLPTRPRTCWRAGSRSCRSRPRWSRRGAFAALGAGQGRGAAVLAPQGRRGRRRGAHRSRRRGAGRARCRGAGRARASDRPLRPARRPPIRHGRGRASARGATTITSRGSANGRADGRARGPPGIAPTAPSSAARGRSGLLGLGHRLGRHRQDPRARPIACCACCWPAASRSRSSA